jgi:hypothetical protein
MTHSAPKPNSWRAAGGLGEAGAFLVERAAQRQVPLFSEERLPELRSILSEPKPTVPSRPLSIRAIGRDRIGRGSWPTADR